MTRRAVLDVIRTAVLGSYGVTGFAHRTPLGRLLRLVGAGRPAIGLDLERGIGIDLSVTVAHGLPVAEVARQVASAVRYAVRRAFDRDVTWLVVHVNGLRVLPRELPPRRADPPRADDDGPTGDAPVELRGSRIRTALGRRAAGDRGAPR